MTVRLLRDWTDARGRPQRVADDVLAAIGARLTPAVTADTPFLSADTGQPLALPGGTAGTAEWVFEDGGRTTASLADDGTILAPERPGYHQLVAGARAFTVALAPRRCPAPPARAWGAAVQIPALRDATPTAFGDAGILARAAPAFTRIGAQALAISPTHALFPGAPARISPYSPSTRLFHNVLLADPSLIGIAAPPSPAPALIDWGHAIPERMALLQAAYAGAGEAVRAAAAAWRRQRGATLEAHARFDALHARLGGDGWRDWPSAFQDAAGDAVIRFAAQEEEEVAFFAFLQWLTDLSLAQAQRTARDGMAIGLIADLAIGMAPDGSHAWSAPQEVLRGLSIGAPPDPLGPQGQNWGITALDPVALEQSGFRPFIDTLRAAFAHAGGVRIDHALGLERLWVIPEGADASQGAYLTMPGEHLRRIVAIEAQRAGGIVIAEDLGTVPPGLREALAQRCMMGMRVLPFERDAGGGFIPPAIWDEGAVAMTGTHDTPTVVGWWTARDLDWARRLDRAVEDDRAADRTALWQALGGTGDPPADVPLDAILAHVAAAPGALALFPLEDLLGLEEQPNLPGTIDEHPNWRRRLPADIHALLAQRAVVRRARLLTSERPG